MTWKNLAVRRSALTMLVATAMSVTGYARGQDCSLHLESRSADPAYGVLDIAVILDNECGPLIGWYYNICHDSTLLDIDCVGLQPGFATQTSKAGFPHDFSIHS